MKTWIRRTLIGALGATVLLGGLAACASHRHHQGWAMGEAEIAKMRERFVDKASRELALDEAQRSKLNALADALQAQRAALRAPVGQTSGDVRLEMQALVSGAQFDRARAQALVDAKTGAVRDKAPAVVSAMGDFFDSLKPEQQQKLRDFMARRGGHRWGQG